MHEMASLLAAWSDAQRRQLAPFLEAYSKNPAPPAQAALPKPALLLADQPGGAGQFADLQTLVLGLQSLVRLGAQVQGLWIIVALAAQACFDRDLDAAAETSCAQTERQLAWCRTQIKRLAPQLLSAPTGNVGGQKVGAS